MKKPIELAVSDFNTSLVNLINNSGLPAFIIVQSLQSVLVDVNRIAEENLQKAREDYQKGETDE